MFEETRTAGVLADSGSRTGLRAGIIRMEKAPRGEFFGLHGVVLALGAKRCLGAVAQHHGQQALAALPLGRLHIWKRAGSSVGKETPQNPSPNLPREPLGRESGSELEAWI